MADMRRHGTSARKIGRIQTPGYLGRTCFPVTHLQELRKHRCTLAEPDHMQIPNQQTAS